MAYSQALIKFGYIKGAGLAKSIQTETSPNDYRYMTDGLPVVLVFGNRPTSLGGIDYFNWEQLADYR